MTLIQTSTVPIWIADGRTQPDQPVMVLIHGAGGSRLQWPGALRHLPGVGVIAVDLPGHGKSPAPSRDSIPAYAADVVALLDTLQIQRAIFGGHSMGGGIALWLAIEYPARAAGLVLVGTGAKLAVHPDLLRDSRENPEQAARTMVEWMWSDDAPADLRQKHYESLISLPRGILYGDFSACNAFDARERLSGIHMPTLILGGTRDRMTPPRYSTYLQEHIAGAELVLLEAAHMLMLEQPDAVGAAVRTWLQNHNSLLTQ
jgi:pimeloyl-ACP methyl ester carboxylesterase